ncbi:hypothetical protein [Nocardia carnea]|uniref:hypothetical protein n=1 Tax=Nocardia carnea TaxID=37328 RepID=UPI002458859F|nr:hypothetical protein [Nocardia carnea]
MGGRIGGFDYAGSGSRNDYADMWLRHEGPGGARIRGTPLRLPDGGHEDPEFCLAGAQPGIDQCSGVRLNGV